MQTKTVGPAAIRKCSIPGSGRPKTAQLRNDRLDFVIQPIFSGPFGRVGNDAGDFPSRNFTRLREQRERLSLLSHLGSAAAAIDPSTSRVNSLAVRPFPS